MKEGKYAKYMGIEYTSGKNKDGTIILRSTNINDIEKGFKPCEPFFYKNSPEKIVCLKFVNRSEIENYYRVQTKAIYKGYEFEVVEESNNMISIVAMTGDYQNWLDLGMKCIDKGVYQKWIDKSEAQIKIIKETLL